MFNAVDIKTVRGVKKLRKGILPDVPAYRFRREVHGLQFPADIAARLRHDVRGALTMHFVGKQNKRTDSVLFSVDVPGASSPWLRLSSDVKHKLLRLQATIKDGRRQTLTLPNAFVDHKHWHKVALAINTTHVRMYIDCVQDHVSKELTGVDFAWPENASVSILQDSHGGNSFKGSMQVATLYLRNVKQKPWLCNETEKPGQDIPSRSKNQGAPRANNNVEMKGQRGPQKAARDKLTAADRQKAAEVPAGVLTMKNWKGLIENDLMGMLDHSPRIVEYQHTMEALRIEVEKLKTKNEALTRRVTSLETCECQQRAASPCLSQPCLNGGTCLADATGKNHTCRCDKYFTGARCDQRINVCVYPLATGNCDMPMKRYFYNMTTGSCDEFQFSGCDGNLNNFESSDECEGICTVGACCHRQLTRPPGGALGRYLYSSPTCEVKEREDCEVLMSTGTSADSLISVVSFTPGDTASSAHPGCMFANTTYGHGERFRLACQECSCDYEGRISCRCAATSVRKDMRLMSDDELTRFQVALATLQEQWHGGALAALARVYSNHVMQANSPAFFLPWNRLFLRQFEQLLQQVDCTVTLPYFDFTTHVGNFTNAPLWNSAYFGGKGCTSDSTAASQLCVSRRFSSIQLPSAVEIAIAMATNDYMTMSASLETYAFLVHEFVGGHMATSAAVYDPAFYALHAYVDALWDRWQHRSGGDGGSYPPEYVDVTMLPFNVAPADVLDSAAQTCVAYPRSPARACDSSIPYQRAVDILQRQGDGFLRTVGRTCPPLVAPSSRVAYRLGVGDRMQQQLPALPVAKATSDVSRSACFDVELFTHSSCPCEQPIATCKFNPCSATCDAYPDAVCTLDFCGSCVGHWSRGGAPVKCHKDVVCIDGLGGSHSEQSWWQSTEDECHNCTCVGGQQQCEHRGCPATPCTHPVHPDDSCCPLCTDCLLDNVTHADGAPIRTADPCEECRCDGGSVMCRVGPCECDHKGRLYEHGESFYDGHPCINCTCNKGDVTCERLDLLCRPRCAHPARVRGGDVCCPTCDNCEYHGSYYRNGQKFTMTTDGMCQLCSCEDGDVTCAVEKCESPQCDNPEVVAGSCCLHCPPLCTIGVAVYEEGDIWVDEADACKTCVCKASQAVCTEDLCVPVSCSHPSKPADSCCPVCERCQVSELTYDNGQQFTHADDPCQTCSCAHGNITCEPVGCPTLQCDTPCPPDNPNCRKAQPGECCPTCNVCRFEGSTYGDGTSFTSPLDSCQVCECDYPYVTCKRLPCPPAACHHPAASGCCAACVDCNYGNRTWSNGEEFVSPLDNCDWCACSAGRVQCTKMRCATPRCSHPVQNGCCKECTDCYIDGQQVADGASLDYEHSCITCECRHGNGECHQRACTPVSCSHPVTTGCCPECGSCEYKDQLVLNGQLFAEPDDPCVSCECHQGNISCGPLQCPTVACTHPSRGQCCLECHTCNYGDRVYANGERFEDETRPCEECNCKSGNVECSVKNCPLVSCSDPKPGPCCPECNRPCSHHGQMYKHGQTFPSLDEECNECVCSDGEVSCHIRPCPPVRCTHPRDGACCQTCDSGCLFLDKVYAAGASLTNPANKCEVCRCYGGDMQCHTLDCPTLSCSSTYIPAGECCPVCSNVCLYDGVAFENGQSWVPPSHPCQLCTCRNGYTNCGLKPCPACSHPKLVDGACCPTCTDCFYHGQEYTNGSDFSAGCEQCACVNGDVTCAPLTCPDLDCDNPVLLLDECCPTCPQCSVDGLTFRDGENFPNPADRCENCTCRGTAVHCVRRPCTATCAHPVPDKCCPQCDGCYYKHQTYTNKQLFKPGPCQTCVCDDGSVTCTADKCAELSCQFRIRDPGSCCERCQGCSYEGQEYEEHAIWPSKHDSCVKCTCHQGVVTCARKHCMTPCARSFLRPGQCCPVCRGCYYKGALHISGKVFHPDNDICQTCQCEGGALQCWKETCPALLDCPADEVLPPAHDQCCPHCARHLVSSCTALSVDVVPTSDPCYTCRCSQHGSWLCERRQCPLLSNCPQSEIYMPPGECCQKCKLCYSEADGAFFRDGHVWPAMTDPCEQHSCRGGVVSTSRLVCPVLHCRPDELRQLLPFDCCEECVHRSNLTCIVSGQLHSGGERWQLDDCTHCVCEEGENLCTVQTCEPLNCRPDQVPFMAPGACCPECITRPVTCVGFGDPHYRTFDGNMVHFQGTCRYVLAADCVTGNFTVEVVNTDRGHRGSVAWTESVTVKIAGSVYDLLRQGRVRVNGEDVDLPLLHRPQVLVEKTGNTIMLTTNVGMKVLWNGDSYAEVSVQPAYMRKMCGLCGNYNSYPPDDLRMRSGDLTTSAAVFGNSWKVPDSSRESQCKDAIDIDPCVQGGYAARKLATTKCAVIRGPIFRPCHRVVSPEPFFASCVYDLCACAHTEPCLCDILGTYALECAQAGVTLNWRSEALCDEQCDTELGLIWEECGPPCHRTCANKEVALSKLNAECYKPCVPGCRCSADRVLYDGQCIAPSDCPV